MAWRSNPSFDTVQLTPKTVAELTALASGGSISAGAVAHCSNGAAGDPILCTYDGTNWLRSDTGAAISAE